MAPFVAGKCCWLVGLQYLDGTRSGRQTDRRTDGQAGTERKKGGNKRESNSLYTVLTEKKRKKTEREKKKSLQKRQLENNSLSD